VGKWDRFFMNDLNGYKDLMKYIGYEFKDSSLLITALSHSSYINELKLNKHEDYERLEFLGDAVLELTVSDFLYRNNPNLREGSMSKLRSSMVCEPTLAFCARSGFNLGRFLLLGKGEENTGGRGRDSIVSDAFEAIIGAIYLDGGIERAVEFINKFVLSDYEKKIEFSDSKSLLQEYAQDKGLELKYELIEESGPAHDRDYRIKAVLGDKYEAEGLGKNKKNAEQHAAYEILKELHLENGVQH